MSQGSTEGFMDFARGLSGKQGFKELDQRIASWTCTNHDVASLQSLLSRPAIPETGKAKIRALIEEVRKRVAPQVPEEARPIDSTFRREPLQDQQEAHKFIEGKIIAAAKTNRGNPPLCIEEILKVLKNPPRRETTEAVFKYFSADEMLLPDPLHLIGRAIIRYSEVSPGFLRWIMSLPDGVTRLEWIRGNIKRTEDTLAEKERTDKAKREADEMISSFEGAFSKRDRTVVMSRGMEIFSANFFSQEQQKAAFMAQMLTSERILSEAKMTLAGILAHQYSAYAKPMTSAELLPDMLVSMEALKAKVERLGKVPSTPTQKPRKIKKRVEESPPPLQAKLPPDKQAICSKVQAVMRDPDRNKFLSLVRTAVQKHGKRMNIDPDPAKVNFRGKGGTCVVLEMKYPASTRGFAARFDIESVGEGEDAQIASQLATRSSAIHSKVNHTAVVKYIDYDALPIELVTDAGVVTVMVTFQSLELLDRALSGGAVIQHLEESGLKPKPMDVLEIMHKLFDPIHFMHEMDIVHRDIKPENIMFIPPPGWNGEVQSLLRDGTIKFLDFGIARDNTQETKHSYSSPDRVPGTLPFIAPECFTDGTRTRNPANDVYALGITLYKFIIGKDSPHPFEVSRKRRLDFSNAGSAASAIGDLGYEAVDMGHPVPSVVSIDDPGIQEFLRMKHPLQKTEDSLAWKIVQLVIRMCDPNPANRPTIAECVAFTESSESVPQNSNALAGFLRSFAERFKKA